MALDDVITTDKTDIGYVDIDWDIIQQEKDKLVNSTDTLKLSQTALPFKLSRL